MKKILILGYGYVGGYLYTELKKKNDVVIIKKDFLDYTNSKDLIKFLKLLIIVAYLILGSVLNWLNKRIYHMSWDSPSLQ